MLVSIQTVDMYWFTSVTYGQNFVAVRYHMGSGEYGMVPHRCVAEGISLNK